MNPILKDFPDHFETERLLIRAPRPGEGQMVYEAVMESLEQLKLWMQWAHQEMSPEIQEGISRQMHANFLARQSLPLRLFHKETGELVGGSGLHRFDWDVPRFEIGYWVRTKFEGQGYVTEAVIGITNFAFEKLFAERVEIRMDTNNIRSWRVAERAGFTLEGILRNNARTVNGKLRSTRVYSMIRAEWLERHEIRD
ncbi:MAG: GNAT family N-acetyltransferase [Chloroflexi bacterium UTCFX4]|nr:MAG: GNAT family N-acetyltransferase [Chloroflexi bacterium UTCFX4]